VIWGLRVEGRENVPRSGPLLVTCNHVSNLDPPVVACAIPREIGFVAKRELFAVPGLGSLIRSLNAMPLDRSRLSVEALDRFGAFLREGNALLMFPEGTRSRTGRLGKAKVGVGVLMARFPAQVVPVYVQGTDTLFRSMLRRGRMRIVFGRPYSLPKGEGPGVPEHEEYRRLAELILDGIRQLKEGTDASERGAGPPATEARGA
jgi:1-acyl-sn-glycerol-3-phosphate acyltransferase